MANMYTASRMALSTQACVHGVDFGHSVREWLHKSITRGHFKVGWLVLAMRLSDFELSALS